jgi:hypothetical protein
MGRAACWQLVDAMALLCDDPLVALSVEAGCLGDHDYGHVPLRFP